MFYFGKIKVHNRKIRFDLDMSRFERQFQKAQFDLDTVVMTDMVPYMPKVTGTFINTTRAMSAAIAGTGYVYAAAPPMGRFLYEGKTMVSPSTGSTYAKKGEKKVLVSQYKGKTNAQENLVLRRTGDRIDPHWFDIAKQRHGESWVVLAKKRAGGGNG